MDNYIPYQESYPNLEQALKEGAKIHVSRSGGGLRVVRVEKEKKLVSYGEHPYFSGALAHAESDFGLSYEELYCNDDAKHVHYLTGAYALPHDILDLYVCNQGANAFDITYSKKWEEFICTRPSQRLALPNHENIIWGAGLTLLGAIAESFVNSNSSDLNIEDKELFMYRCGIQP